MSTILEVAEAEGRDGFVHLRLTGPSGEEFTLRLAPMEVSSVTSMLNGARDEALNQPVAVPIEQALLVHSLALQGDDRFVMLRLTVAPNVHHDYATPSDSPLAAAWLAMAESLGATTGKHIHAVPPPTRQ